MLCCGIEVASTNAKTIVMQWIVTVLSLCRFSLRSYCYYIVLAWNSGLFIDSERHVKRGLKSITCRSRSTHPPHINYLCSTRLQGFHPEYWNWNSMGLVRSPIFSGRKSWSRQISEGIHWCRYKFAGVCTSIVLFVGTISYPKKYQWTPMYCKSMKKKIRTYGTLWNVQ